MLCGCRACSRSRGIEADGGGGAGAQGGAEAIHGRAAADEDGAVFADDVDGREADEVGGDVLLDGEGQGLFDARQIFFGDAGGFGFLRTVGEEDCVVRAAEFRRERSRPMATPRVHSTPRFARRSTRRATMDFSSLKAGMPLTRRPPGRSSDSKTVTA